MKTTNTFKRIASAMLTAVMACFLTASPTLAVTDVCDPSVPAEVQAASGCGNNSDQFASTITGILNAVIGIASLVAVVFIIIGGINYMTSTGDAAKVKKGKDTIVYALIGLVICALAFAVVNWVIFNALGSGGTTNATP